jgi:hypothetical protein
MQESCPYGSVRGAPSNGCPYRNRQIVSGFKALSEIGPIRGCRVSIVETSIAVGGLPASAGQDHEVTQIALPQEQTHPTGGLGPVEGYLSLPQTGVAR